MKLVFQIFTGDLTRQSLADPQVIIEKLRKAHEAGRLAGVAPQSTRPDRYL